MFGLLSVSQFYGIQEAPQNHKTHQLKTNNLITSQHNFSFFKQQQKNVSNLFEKLLKNSDLLPAYENLKFFSSKTSSAAQSDSNLYETVSLGLATTMTVKCSKNLLAPMPNTQAPATLQNYQKLPDEEQHHSSNACHTLDAMTSSAVGSSGASSGEFNENVVNNVVESRVVGSASTGSTVGNLYKRLSFGSRNSKNFDVAQAHINEASDNSSSSISTSTTHSSSHSSGNLASSSLPPSKSPSTLKANDLLHRSSSASSSGDCRNGVGALLITPERAQRRKLMQMISNYDQQNKLLQRELAKEKRRRTEELACVVKSLLCFEAKLKNDMKSVNQRLQDKDAEICRLVRQNRALRKCNSNLRQQAQKSVEDEGVVEDEEEQQVELRRHCSSPNKNQQDDVFIECLELEALQCINCRKQFYDIELKESWSQTSIKLGKEGLRNNDGLTTELGSSSDDTVSSSFYGARRSVRYTSKRTSGTFRDYMRSRAMNIDDPSLEQNSEENTSTVSREESQSSYEKINIYSRTMERMHGVRVTNEREANVRVERSASRSSSSSKSSSSKVAQMEEDDGIFSPTQDEEDFDDYGEEFGSLKIVQRRSREFSEASPKQIYETSTDDWYASASDQEESNVKVHSNSNKSYGCGAVNPVLECVNQILLQQSMDESMEKVTASSSIVEQTKTCKLVLSAADVLLKTPPSSNNLPRRSSLSDRRTAKPHNNPGNEGSNSRAGTLTRKRVHFSTKNSMVHVPRNDEHEDDAHHPLISATTQEQLYHSMSFHHKDSENAEQERLEALNYESIYSNEYEPIFGSEQNSSNLYVDMESNAKLSCDLGSSKIQTKLPPALPPKPANLLKFKKSLQQLDEIEEHLQGEVPAAPASSNASTSDPDYCSIAEVGMKSVQIVAQVHQPPSNKSSSTEEQLVILSSSASEQADLELEVSTVASDLQKTDEIEEILADIPKLPNVAAIIAPKFPNLSNQNDYLVMTPKNETKNNKSHKLDSSGLRLQLNNSSAQVNQYKRKHVPNILVEINKRMSQPNSPTTPTKPSVPLNKSLANSASTLKSYDNCSPSLPLQAEFDWYNLDAEYGKSSNAELLKVGGGDKKLLEEIHEDHQAETACAEEVDVVNADEYNLDEEFSLASDGLECGEYLVQQEEEKHEKTLQERQQNEQIPLNKIDLNEVICEAVNFPLYGENTPFALTGGNSNSNTKNKKIKKNLANFEKFIEGTGMSSKPLPSKRKLYFGAGPFV